MHITIFLWGFTGVLGKGIDLSEGVLVWYRMLFAVCSMLLYFLFSKESLAISKKDFFRLTIVGFIIMIHWVCFYGSIKYANVSIALCMLAAQGLFTSIFEPLFHREKIKKTNVLFGLIAMLGIWIIFWSEKIYIVGSIIGLFAALFGAIFNVLNKPLVEKISPTKVSFYEMLTGLIILTLLMPAYIYFSKTEKLIPTFFDFSLLIILAVICTHLAIVMSLKALKFVSAFTLNLSTNLEPIYGIILAFLIFNENQFLGKGFYIGAFIILLSVALQNFYALKYDKH